MVVDPTINAARMEMYADVDSRGGILEPPGICEVKFRSPDQKKVMARTDAELAKLLAQPASAERDAAEARVARSGARWWRPGRATFCGKFLWIP